MLSLRLGLSCALRSGATFLLPLLVSQSAAAEQSSKPVAHSMRMSGESATRAGNALLLTGEIRAASAHTLVVPRVPQWHVTLRWIADNGSRVSKGQTVAEVDDSAFTRELSQKKTAAAKARSALLHQQNANALTLLDKRFEVAQAKINLEKAKLRAAVDRLAYPLRVYQEMQLELARSQSEQARALDALKVHTEASELEVAVLRIDLTKREREIETAERAIEALSLKAPKDGIVVTSIHPWFRRKIQSGDNVWVNLPLVHLPELSSVEVQAWLSDVDDGRILSGDRVEVVLDAYSKLTFLGTVTAISPVARERSANSPRRAFAVRVELDRVDPDKMLPGMSVRVRKVSKGAG